MQVSGLQKNCRKLKLLLYEENKAEAIQDTERSKSWKVQKGWSRMDLEPYMFIETYIKKKEGEKKKDKERNVFLCTTGLELRRGRRLMHTL